MAKINQKSLDAYRNIKDDFNDFLLWQESSFLLTREKDALSAINDLQEVFKVIKKEKKNLIKRLEVEGWNIEFCYREPRFSDIVLYGTRLNASVKCTATKEVGEDKEIVITKTAVVADDDIYIKLLGEYLSLARVYTAIKEE